MTQVSAVRDRKVTQTNGVTNPVAIDYPDLVEAGDVLVLLVTTNQTSVTTATGWTSLGAEDFGEMFHRTADGSEAGGTFDISIDVSGRDTACMVWSIREDLNPGTPEAASAADSATTDDFDPPSLSPTGGDRLYLWIVGGQLLSINTYLTSWDSTLEDRVITREANLDTVLVASERLFEGATFNPAAMTKSGNTSWAAWNVAVPVDQPANDGFPDIESTSQGSWTTSATTQTLTLPTGIASGDLIQATIATGPNVAVTISGWTVVEEANSVGPVVRGTVIQRQADGTEGATVTVNLSSSGGGSYICRRIDNGDGTKTESATHNLGQLEQNWPALTPTGGADNILWLADLVIDQQKALVGWPTDYGALPLLEQDKASDLSEGVAGGVLARNQATAEPAKGRIDTSDQTTLFTVAIYPAEAPPPPPSGGGNRMGGTGAIRKPPRTPR